MSEPHDTYDRIQSLRINNLEKQVQLMQQELKRLRAGILQKNDIEKLVNFKEKLKEMNAMLMELRTYYNSMQQTIIKTKKNEADKMDPIAKNNVDKTDHHHIDRISSNNSRLGDEKTHKYFARENVGFDHRESSTELPDKQVSIDTVAEGHSDAAKSNDPFKTCKQLMNEIKPPGSILGNYLTRLQDFRADPELRRKRWERKQQQKLQKMQIKNQAKPPVEDKATLTEETDIVKPNRDAENANYLVSPFKTNQSNENFSSNPDIETASNCSFPLATISKNLLETIEKYAKDADKSSIVLTLVLESDFYHLSICQISDGEQLACFLATEEAVQEAKQQHLFQDFLTFFVVNAENSKSQKDRVLGHLFEFIKTDSEQGLDEVE